MPRSRPPAGWVVRLASGAEEDLPWPGQIRDRLRAAILEGAAPPGCAIPVDAVADTFAVSRIPVRERWAEFAAAGEAAGTGVVVLVGQLTPASSGRDWSTTSRARATRSPSSPATS